MIRTTGILLLAVMLLLAVSNAPAYAGWVDDWISSSSVTNPGYFEGQKRGYFAAGNFSMRYQSTGDHLWTVMPPKIKGGCGGIDVFLGGFAFLRDPQYLVDKFKKIFGPGIAAAAFDIGLNVLCEPCSKTIKALEATSNALNSIQLDDCKASRAAIAYAADSIAWKEQQKQELGNIQSDFMQSTGLNDSWQTIKKQTESAQGNPQTDTKQAIGQCTTDIRDIFTTVGPSGVGYVLDNIAAKIGMSLDYAKLIRGYLGDVRISKDATTIKFTRVDKCTGNKILTAEDFLNGKAQYKETDASETCHEITDVNKNLTVYVRNQIQGISDKMKNKTINLTSAENTFLDSSPFSVSLILKYAIGTQQEGQLIDTLSDITAKYMAQMILLDLYYESFKMIDFAKQGLENNSEPVSGQDPVRCKIEMFTDADKVMTQMRQDLYPLMSEVRKSYLVSLQELGTINAFVQNQQKFYEAAYRQLSVQLGSSVISRAIQ